MRQALKRLTGLLSGGPGYDGGRRDRRENEAPRRELDSSYPPPEDGWSPRVWLYALGYVAFSPVLASAVYLDRSKALRS